MITIANRSSFVTDTEAEAIAAAMNIAVPTFCDSWARKAYTVKFITTIVAESVAASEAVPVAASTVAPEVKVDAPAPAKPEVKSVKAVVAAPSPFFSIILTDSTETKEVADAYIPVAPIINAGGCVLYKDGKTPTVASYVSHEIYNAIVDHHSNTWIQTAGSTMVSGDVCDPVFDGIVPIRLGKDGVVTVVGLGNYTIPAWRNPWAPEGAKFDHLGVLSSPFSISAGGMTVYMNGGGEKTNVTGKNCNFLALHNRSLYPTSRTQRRINGPGLRDRRSKR